MDENTGIISRKEMLELEKLERAIASVEGHIENVAYNYDQSRTSKSSYRDFYLRAAHDELSAAESELKALLIDDKVLGDENLKRRMSDAILSYAHLEKRCPDIITRADQMRAMSAYAGMAEHYRELEIFMDRRHNIELYKRTIDQADVRNKERKTKLVRELYLQCIQAYGTSNPSFTSSKGLVELDNMLSALEAQGVPEGEFVIYSNDDKVSHRLVPTEAGTNRRKN